MAGKKRKTTTTVEEIVPENILEPEEQGPTELDYNLEDVQTAEKLSEIVEQFPQAGITVKLYDEDGAYCMQILDPTHIDEEIIRKRCGHGNFKLRIYVGGKYRQYIPLPIRQIQPDASVNSSPGSRNGDNGYSHSDFLERQAQRTHELLLAALTNHGSGGPSLTDITTALSNIDNLRGKQESALEMVLKGIELAKSMNGDTDWKSDLVQMGREVLPKISDGVMSVMGNRNGQAQAIGNSTETSSPPEVVITPEAIKMGIGYLKKKCLSGVPVDLIIDWVTTNADEYQGLIHVILNQDFAEFAKFDMEIGSEPFLSWFRQLFDGLRSAFSSTDSVDNDTGRMVGNTSDPRNHGESREGGESKSGSSTFSK